MPESFAQLDAQQGELSADYCRQSFPERRFFGACNDGLKIMNIMPFRYDQLAQALEGLRRTGVPLVASDHAVLTAAGASDDPGIYYAIPKLVDFLGVSLTDGIAIFYLGVIVASFFIGCAGFYVLFEKWGSRLIAWLALLLLSIVTYRIGDVYVISAAVVMATVPPLLAVTERRLFGVHVCLAVFLVSVVAGAANTFRSHAGTAVIIFMLVLFLAARGNSSVQKLVLLLILVFGLLLPIGFKNHLINARDAYLSKQVVSYQPVKSGHPFWHSVYLGLSFVPNPYVKHYLDEDAVERVKQVNPAAGFLSREYNNILRDEIRSIAKNDPYFLLVTVGAKVGVLLLYLLLFSNLGLIAALFYRKDWRIEAAFWSALVFSGMFGMLVIPHYNYLLGFMAFATLYGIAGIHAALEGGVLNRRSTRVPAE